MNRKTFLTSLVGFIAAPWRSLTAPKVPLAIAEEKIGQITYQTFKIDHLKEGDWVSMERDMRGKWKFTEVPIRYQLKDGAFVMVEAPSKG